jgi:hypothetical protein
MPHADFGRFLDLAVAATKRCGQPCCRRNVLRLARTAGTHVKRIKAVANNITAQRRLL